METYDHNPAPAAESRKWVERHVLLVIVMLVGLLGFTVVMCCGGLVAMVFHMTRSSPIYTTAMARLNRETAIMQRIGEPVEPGWLMSSSMTIHNDQGEATMRIPLKGAKENAEVFIEAEKHGGPWQLTYLAVQFEKDAEGSPMVIVGVRRDR